MSARVTLKKFVTEEYVSRSSNGSNLRIWPLRVQAIGDGIDSNVFVYQRTNEAFPVPGDRFTCVASTLQMIDIPTVDTYLTGDDYQVPFYRTDVIEVFCETVEDLEHLWVKIKDDVGMLLHDWNSVDRMKNTEVEVISEDPPLTIKGGFGNPINFTLSRRPAGEVVSVDGVAHIGTADQTITGWLPISELAYILPENNAAYFYNHVEGNGVLHEISKIREEEIPTRLLLFIGEVQIPYGKGWYCDGTNLFWKLNHMGLPKTPWSPDYIDEELPGADTRDLTLIIIPKQ